MSRSPRLYRERSISRAAPSDDRCLNAGVQTLAALTRSFEISRLITDRLNVKELRHLSLRFLAAVDHLEQVLLLLRGQGGRPCQTGAGSNGLPQPRTKSPGSIWKGLRERRSCRTDPYRSLIVSVRDHRFGQLRI
jgi:hypothetical protein